MKLDKKTLSLLVIVFVILALVVAIPETFNGKSEQKSHLANGRAYFEKDLCLLAIDEYKKAIEEEDNIEVELEMADVYYRAYENGELKVYHDIESFYDNLVTNFREESEAYDAALNFYYNNEDYASVVEVLTQAQKLNVKSDMIAEMTENVRYKYSIGYSIISDMERSVQGFYTVKDGEKYQIYNDKLSNVFQNVFDYASVFINNYLVAKEGDYTFIFSADGKRVAYLENTIDFSTGLGGELIACRNNDVFSYYNLSGEKIFGEYLFAGRFREGYAAVQTEQGWTIIDTEGNTVTDKYFEDIKYGPSYESVTEGCFFAKEGEKYSIYNIKGEKVSDLEFDNCDIFINKDSYAAVSVDDKWGFVNLKGEMVIDCQFNSAKSFSNGLAFVSTEEGGAFVNTDGLVVITGDFIDGEYFNDKGMCLVKGEAFWQPIQRYYTLN